MTKEHHYELSLSWTGNLGKGNIDYKAYERSYKISVQGKPNLLGSSDPAYLGDATRWNPEEMLLASLSACHMLWYLHICTENKIVINDYVDNPIATMIVAGEGKITEAILKPAIQLADPSLAEKAKALHALAHKKCFIANSINFPVKIEPIFN